MPKFTFSFLKVPKGVGGSTGLGNIPKKTFLGGASLSSYVLPPHSFPMSLIQGSYNRNCGASGLEDCSGTFQLLGELLHHQVDVDHHLGDLPHRGVDEDRHRGRPRICKLVCHSSTLANLGL